MTCEFQFLKICAAASPTGAAAVHLFEAEQEVLRARSADKLGIKPSVFLVQAIPLDPVLDDLRRLEEGLREWIVARENHTVANGYLPARTPRGLVLEGGNRWRFDVHANGYVGFAAFSRLLPHPPRSSFFALGHELSPLPRLGNLLAFVAQSLELPSDETWRIRCTVLEGPAFLLAAEGQKGLLPDKVVDLSGVPTSCIGDRLAALSRLLESLCRQPSFD